MKMFHRNLSVFLVVLALLLGTALVAQAAAPNLMAAFFVKGKVGLKWAPVEGASEYLIYRQAAGEDFVQIGTTGEDRFFDTEVTPGETYMYKVAVMDGGTEVFSGEKSVTIPGEIGGFLPPNWVGIRYDQDKLFLNWDKVPGAMAYNVWRSSTTGSGYENIGTAQGTRFVDKAGLEKGTTYYYVLTAMNAEFDETPFSVEESAKYGISEEERALLTEEDKIVLDPYPISMKFELTEGRDRTPINQPSDVEVNSQGNIYVVDALGGQIQCYDAGGTYQFSFGELVTGAPSTYPDGQFMLPFTISIDSNDQVYISDVKRNDIQVFSPDGKFVRRIHVDTGMDMNPLRANGLHVMADGRLLMTDTGNHRFLITDSNGKILLAKGEKGGEEGQFLFPDGITVTPDNEIFVVDTINYRVQVFSMDGQFLRAFGGPGYSAGLFGRPKDIEYDGKGLVWVSDSMSHMVQGFSTAGEIKSALGTNEDEWTFLSPRGICFSDGQLLLVQRLANKVVVYSVGP